MNFREVKSLSLYVKIELDFVIIHHYHAVMAEYTRGRKLGGKFLTTLEAAQHLGFSEGTLRNWRSRKVGPPYFKSPTGSIRYCDTELDEWIRTNGNNA